MTDPNREQLIRTVNALGDICDELVFLGGSIVGLLMTDTGSEPVRATEDVDVIVEVTSRLGYERLGARLEAKGFRPDPNGPICRYTLHDMAIDVMPLDESILGFANRWYKTAIAEFTITKLNDHTSIKVITAPVFIATKLVAYHTRGKADPIMSHDLEDVLMVVDGRKELLTEIQNAPLEVQDYLAQEFGVLQQEAFFDDLIGTFNIRAEIMRERLEKIENKLNFDDLPAFWETHPLSQVFKLAKLRERAVKIQKNETYRLLTVKLYAKGITLRSKVQGEKIGVSTLYETRSEDFIVSKIDARSGAWGFVPNELVGGLVSGDFPIFRINEKVADVEFIGLILEQPRVWQPLRENAIGSTGRRRVQANDFLNLEIPLPPLLEQRAIASALRTIRRARDATAQVLAEARELKRSLMRHLFTFGAVAVQDAANVELQETEIGMMPKNWDVKTLSEVAKLSTGTTPSTENLNYYNGEIPFLKTGEINGEVIRRTNETLTELALNDYSLTIYPSGTVFMAMYGQGKTRGQVAISGIPLTTTQNAAAIQTNNDKLLNYFAFEYLKSQYLRLREDGHHVQITHLSLAHLRKFQLPIPSRETQDQLIEKIQFFTLYISSLESRVSALDDLFQSALHALMTGQKRLPLEGGQEVRA
jgi:type I restriction enzyme, S subunit